MSARMETFLEGGYFFQVGKIEASGKNASFMIAEPEPKPLFVDNEVANDTFVKSIYDNRKFRAGAAIGSAILGFAGAFSLSETPKAGAISCDTPEPMIKDGAYHAYWERWIIDPKNNCGLQANSSSYSGQLPSAPSRAEATTAGGQLYMPEVSYLPECPPGWKGFVVEDLEAHKEGERRELELGSFKANPTINNSSKLAHAIDLGDIKRADGGTVKYVGSAPNPGTYCVSPNKATEAPPTNVPTTTTTTFPAESVSSLPAGPALTKPTEWACPYPGILVTFDQPSTNIRYYAFEDVAKRVDKKYNHPKGLGDAERARQIYSTDPSYTLEGSADAPPQGVPICIFSSSVDISRIPGTPPVTKQPTIVDRARSAWERARDSVKGNK